jgi:4-diphosphocytidyl-2-C-methyl-D-erythritol kinase
MNADAAGDGWNIWPAPAKLNLFLHITGRRADGYHLLQTVFQLLDWGDSLRLRVRADGSIHRVEALAGVAADADLSVRAARLLKETTACPLGADIAIDKRIPLGGGLGGGSSDAATTLVALNALWNCGLDAQALADLGLRLGADVPVFVKGHSAFAEGVGERLMSLDLPERTYVVVDPGISVPTHELFQAVELTRDTPPMTIAGFVSGAKTRNAFEPVVRARYPAVAQVLDWLAAYGEPRLSGSGGAVFVAVDADVAQKIAAQCPSGMRAWIARGVNRSPLLAALAGRTR